ncbi:hypothetical protein SD53_06415 [Rheinheimera mesophila]|nr:hypothetical protein SD53_06415 [Rheinheimera mesophila]
MVLSIAILFSFLFILPGNLSAQITMGTATFVIISMIFFFEKNNGLGFFGNLRVFSFNLVLSLFVALPLVFLTVWLSHYVSR